MSWSRFAGNRAEADSLAANLAEAGFARYYVAYESGDTYYFWAISEDEASDAASAAATWIADGYPIEDVRPARNQEIRKGDYYQD